jgi:hypothetical protein
VSEQLDDDGTAYPLERFEVEHPLSTTRQNPVDEERIRPVAVVDVDVEALDV